MGLKSKAYKDAVRAVKDKDYAVKRLKLLFVRVLTRIERITIFLREDEIPHKTLKDKISLLSSLLEVKKKIRVELKDLESDSGKQTKTLGKILE